MNEIMFSQELIEKTANYIIGSRAIIGGISLIVAIVLTLICTRIYKKTGGIDEYLDKNLVDFLVGITLPILTMIMYLVALLSFYDILFTHFNPDISAIKFLIGGE